MAFVISLFKYRFLSNISSLILVKILYSLCVIPCIILVLAKRIRSVCRWQRGVARRRRQYGWLVRHLNPKTRYVHLNITLLFFFIHSSTLVYNLYFSFTEFDCDPLSTDLFKLTYNTANAGDSQEIIWTRFKSFVLNYVRNVEINWLTFSKQKEYVLIFCFWNFTREPKNVLFFIFWHKIIISF